MSASSPATASRPPSAPEDIAFYHGAFVRHVASSSASEVRPDPVRHKASLEKLANFSQVHLSELSADMYDELQRRLHPENFPSGPLSPRDDIHWKRNDARKHVGSLPMHRFTDICRDLVTEQQRRFPELKNAPLVLARPESLNTAGTSTYLSAKDDGYALPISPVDEEYSSAGNVGQSAAVSVDESCESFESALGEPGDSSPSLHIQSVSQRNLLPTKTQIVESDTETDSDGDMYDDETDLHSNARAPAEQGSSQEPALGETGPDSTGEETMREDTGLYNRTRHDSDTSESSLDDDAELNAIGPDGLDAVDSKPMASPETPGDSDIQPHGRGADSPSAALEQEEPLRVNKRQDNEYPLSPPSNNNSRSRTTSTGSNKAMAPSQLLAGSLDEPATALASPLQSREPATAVASSPASTLDASKVEEAAPDAKGPSHWAELEKLSQENTQLKARVAELESRGTKPREPNPELLSKLEQQRLITEQVRQEAAQFLSEMRALTRQHEQQVSRADGLDAEAKHWKQRHGKLASELDRTRRQRLMAAIPQPIISPVPGDLISPDGSIAERQLQQLATALSTLLACAHSDRAKRTDLLEELHTVVLGARAITATNAALAEKSLVPRATNQLITVVRNFSVSRGLLPLLILDSACSDLAMAVLEFAETVKVKPLTELRIDPLMHGERLAPLSLKTPITPADQYTQMPFDTQTPPVGARGIGVVPSRIISGMRGSSFSTQRNSTGTRGTSAQDELQSTYGAPDAVAASDPSPDPEAEATAAGYEKLGSGPQSRNGSARNSESSQSAANGDVNSPRLRNKNGGASDHHRHRSGRSADLRDVSSVSAATSPAFASATSEAAPLEASTTSPAESHHAHSRLASGHSRSISQTLGEPFRHNVAEPTATTQSLSRSVSKESSGGRFRPVQGPVIPVDMSLMSLRTYLEEQTSGTVDAIGALLSGIKDNATAGELKPLIGKIETLVEQMSDATDKTIGETRSRVLREKGAYLVGNLRDCLARLAMLRDEELDSIRDDAKPNRHLKQRLAGVNFDMAKSTKELVKTVEEVSLQDELAAIDGQLS